MFDKILAATVEALAITRSKNWDYQLTQLRTSLEQIWLTLLATF